jgi:hypothetical protein
MLSRLAWFMGRPATWSYVIQDFPLIVAVAVARALFLLRPRIKMECSRSNLPSIAGMGRHGPASVVLDGYAPALHKSVAGPVV